MFVYREKKFANLRMDQQVVEEEGVGDLSGSEEELG